MKLVATRPFANVRSLSLKVGDSEHKDHVPKGARFSIGTAEIAEDLEPADKEKLLRLHHSGCIVPESDLKAVKKIDDEVALENKREERAKATSPGGLAALSDQIATLMAAGAAASATGTAGGKDKGKDKEK